VVSRHCVDLLKGGFYYPSCKEHTAGLIKHDFSCEILRSTTTFIDYQSLHISASILGAGRRSQNLHWGEADDMRRLGPHPLSALRHSPHRDVGPVSNKFRSSQIIEFLSVLERPYFYEPHRKAVVVEGTFIRVRLSHARGPTTLLARGFACLLRFPIMFLLTYRSSPIPSSSTVTHPDL
jgi:hypothetical protein